MDVLSLAFASLLPVDVAFGLGAGRRLTPDGTRGARIFLWLSSSIRRAESWRDSVPVHGCAAAVERVPAPADD